ncbi:MAG: hypothetical protein EZS28_011694 [Streblomastix strix]|uniref:Uncharacterized protein n=1 Tax=Streblomastix strix TaxID=222440 RepID=A0A5J4WDP3_9EUKA|nr:MAG: hypothetical protein EZS28_011694 [Streblomastix strix]
MQLGGRCGYAPKGYYVVHGILTIPDDLNIAISGQQNEIDEFQGVLSSIFEFQDLNRNFQDIEIQQSEKSDENTLQFKPQVLWGMFFESYIHNGEVDNIFRWLDYNTEVDQIAVPPIESCIDQQFAQVPFHFLNDHETGRQKHSFQPIPSTLGKIFIVPDPSTSLFLDYSISSNNSLLKFELNDQESNIKEQFNKTQIIIPHQYSPFHLAKDIWQQLCPWSNPDTEFIHPMTKQEQDEKDSEYELEKSRMKDNDKQQNYQDQKEEISTFPETAD